ncbi:MAG TPA: sugar ABC transporter permease, partial [Candidatus Caccousia avistercoris]|nr:sugar ABC transporter permease [Candidatus Caccousia avistercoris]
MKIKKGWYALFVFPLIAVFVLVVVIPFFTGIGYSFVEWNGLAKVPKVFVGFDNYAGVFTDENFWASMGRTVVFTLITVVTVNVLALAFSLIVTTRLAARNVGRAMLFLPYLIGGLILGYIWKFVLGECMTTLGEMFGNQEVFFNWFTDKTMSFVAMVVVATWQMAGYMMIIYIAGLQAISDDVIEAASVDGAGFWSSLFRIRLPLLMPSITICLFLTLSNCFKIYDVNLSLTGGGPNNATQMISMNIFNEIFAKSRFGYGQAMAIVFFLVVAAITLLQVKFTSDK